MNPGYSNYPRAASVGSGPGIGQRPPGAHFESITEAFNIIRNDLGTWVATTLVSIIVVFVGVLPWYGALFATMFSVGSSASALQALSVGFSLIIYAAAITLQFFTAVGMGAMAMRAARGERPHVADFFAPWRRFFSVFGACLILSIFVMLGATLAVVPAFVVVGLFSLAPFAVYEQEMGVGEAFRWSYDTTRGHFWGISGLVFVATMIAWLGGCLCYVGYLFTGPVPGIVLGLTYLSFRTPPMPPFLPYPPTGPVAAPPAPGEAPAPPPYGDPS